MKIKLIELNIDPVIPELRAEGVLMEEDAGDQLVQRHPLVQYKTYHGPLEKSIKLDSPESFTAEHQKCTVDFFFLNITGNETENSNILILLYCYRTTLLEVLQ